MRRIATLLLLSLTVLWAMAQPKPTYVPDFKKGQTVVYEHQIKKSYRLNANNKEVDDLMLCSPFTIRTGENSLLDFVSMLSTGDSMSSKFSLKVLEATPYAYMMELQLLDIGLPNEVIKDDDAREFIELINIIKRFKLRLLMSRKLGSYTFIATRDFYKQLVKQGHRHQLKIFFGSYMETDDEVIDEMQKGNLLNLFFSTFVPGLNAFADAYNLRCDEGHREEGKLSKDEQSFSFVGDVTKGKDREMNIKSTTTMYTMLRDIRSYAIDTAWVDTIADEDSIAEPETDTLWTEDIDTLEAYEDDVTLCKMQNIITAKMDKNTWLEQYENTTIINYPSGVGTIYQTVRRRND